MNLILLIDVFITVVTIILGFKHREEAFNLFNAGLVFIVFGMVLFLGAIPTYQNFDISSVLMFVGGILLVLGIIALVASALTRSVKLVNLQDLSISFMLSAVCLVYLLHNVSLNFTNLVVPELANNCWFDFICFSKAKIIFHRHLKKMSFFVSWIKGDAVEMKIS